MEIHLRDHLGNTRITLLDDGSANSPHVMQDVSYYPFGLVIDDISYTDLSLTTSNRYLYNGKLERSGNPDSLGELQEDVGLDWGVYPVFFGNYGARFYDPQIARWHVVDPLAEMYYTASPYNYTLNNPIRFIDPDGRQVDEPRGAYGESLKTASYDYWANAEWAKGMHREKNNNQIDLSAIENYSQTINQMLGQGAELDDVLNTLGQTTTVLGIPLDIIKHFGGLEEFNNLLKSGKFEVVWNGQARQWSLNFHGNASVSGNFVKDAKRIYVANATTAAKDARLLNLVKGGGTVLAITGGVVSGTQFFSGNIGAVEFTADMVFTAIAIKGGPGGWIASSFYFLGKTALDHPHDMRSNVGGFDLSNQAMRRNPHQVPRR